MGLLADVATIAAMGGTPVGVASALTAQGKKTFALEPVAPRVLERQIRAALELAPVHAVKLGMVPDRVGLNAIRRALADVDVPWVVDPVVRSSRGQALSSLAPRDYRALAASAVVITPNVLEAEWLLGADSETREETLEAVALELLMLGFGGVALKGGHREDSATDLIAVRDRVVPIRGSLVKRALDRRGTGCRYGSALAVGLARGEPLVQAARSAKRLVRRYLLAG